MPIYGCIAAEFAADKVAAPVSGKDTVPVRVAEKIMSFIGSREKPTSGETMVISHCNNLSLAKQLSDAVKKQFDFKEIIIVPTKGVISLYADDKGIVLAF
jgi:fatty acid-binding protein DegV